MAKQCGKCKKMKTMGSFCKDNTHNDGLSSVCKECKNAYAKQYRIDKPEINRQWEANNRDKIKVNNAKYYQKNKERCFELSQQWKKDHPEQTKEHYRRHTKRYLSVPQNRLSRCVGCAMRKCLSGLKNHRSWQALVGYNLAELKVHLEKLFRNGMSWENYSKWHIDHIRPIASFDFITAEDEDFKKCWALENLQPLWARENFTKGIHQYPERSKQ